MPARKQKPADAQWVIDQNAFAKGLYADYRKMNDEVEEVFKSTWAIPTDNADDQSPASPRIVKPAKPRAIVDKFLTMLATRATLSLQVMPKTTGEAEQRACSLIENWLMGYQRQYQLETKKRVWRDFIYFALLRGRGCMETRFDPTYLNSDYLPLRTLVTDPNHIFSVWGENGIGWYTKEYKRYAWDIGQELESKWEEGKGWSVPDLSEYDDNDEVCIIEYWDKEYCSLVVDDKLVWVNEHEYGFVPLCEAKMKATPLESMEWASQSVLYPILDTLKNQFILASKLATAVDVGFWPKALAQSASGLVMFDTASTPPGLVENVGPDAKLTFVPYTPNYQTISQLMAWLRGDEQLGAIPDIAWGSEPNSLESGFAISQVLAQVQDKVYDEKIALEMALGWDFGHKLSLIETYAGRMNGAKMKVPVSPEAFASYSTAKRRPTVVELSADDIGGRHHVEVTITPDIPQERMVKSQLAASYRAPGVDGAPLFDDTTIRENVINDDHPDQTARRIRIQMLSAKSQVVQETQMLAAEAEWLEENKDIVKIAARRKEQLLNPDKEPMIPASQVKDLAVLLAKELHAQMMGQPSGLNEMLAAADMGGQMPGQGVPLPSTVQPPTAPSAPGGPSPETMPSQMAMQPQDALPVPAELQATQQRRLRPQNGQ